LLLAALVVGVNNEKGCVKMESPMEDRNYEAKLSDSTLNGSIESTHLIAIT
jgi:hypothetical protein